MSKMSLTRRAALAGAPAAAVAMAGGAAVASAVPDPIFAVIADYKAAGDALDAAIRRDNAAAEEEAFDAERDAFGELFETMPTTIGGVAALLVVLGTSRFGDRMSVFHWALDNNYPADQQMLAMAAVLRGQS
jgi:hypothetical protein